MSVLVIAEHQAGQLNSATLKTISAAKQLGLPIDGLVVGHSIQSVADQMASIEGLRTIRLADHVVYQHQMPENIAVLIAELASSYTHVLAPASTFGKNLMPRVAALLDVAQISDITGVQSADTFVRPIYAGNALATVQSLDAIKVITVRSSAFSAAPVGTSIAPIEAVSSIHENSASRFIDVQVSANERPDLNAARIVVSGGRGLQSGENFKLLEQLADKLGAAIGASRAAVDAGFVPNDYQVGQTGKIVAPELYFAIFNS